jgi:hypothetical protein
MARMVVVIRRARLPETKVKPLVVVYVRAVVVKLMLAETAAVASDAEAGEALQVTPAGAAPEAMAQASVTVPVKVPLGVRTTVTKPETPAATVTEDEDLPVASANVKSGASRPVPVRAVVNAVDEALVRTES